MRISRAAAVGLRTVFFCLLSFVFWAKEAQAQVVTHVGSFAAPTVGPPPVDQSITGIGFQPAAVIFYWTKQTSTGAPSYSTGGSFGYGFAACGVPPTCSGAGTANERAIAYVSDTGINPNNAKSYQSQSKSIVVLTSAASPTPDAWAQLKSMDADGFTVTWQDVASSGWIVHYVALGGTDVADSTVSTFTPAAGTGSEGITGVGFEPDFLMFLSIDTEQGIAEVLDAAVNHGKAAIGFAGRTAGGTITQGALTGVSRNGSVNIVTSVWQESGNALVEKARQTANTTLEAQVTSLDADGFTINKTTHDAGTETQVHYLALRGGQYKVGNVEKPCGPPAPCSADIAGDIPPNPPWADTRYQTDVGFNPKGLLFASANRRASSSPEADTKMSFGAAGSLGNQSATYFHDRIDDPADGDVTVVKNGNSTTKAIFLGQGCDQTPRETSPATGTCSGAGRTTAAADVASFDSQGFSLSWTTVDNSNVNWQEEDRSEILYLAMGDNPVDSNIRSIGSYSTGDASVPLSSSTVNFGGGASLPSWVQAGDTLTLDPGGGNQEIFTIASVVTATQVTVTAPAAQDHTTPESYHIGWIYDTGDATIALGDITVTFGSGASLPARVGAGDKLVIGGETFFVASRVSATEAIVQTAATINHAPPEAYTLERAYKLLQDWETDRQGDLVALDRLEVGMAYNDGPFTTGAIINGSTTDATQYLHLTVAPGHRHTGIAGTGVVLDGGDTDQGLRLSDDYTVVEWFEFTRNRGSANAAGLVLTDASNVLIQKVIIHDFFDLGNFVTGIRAQSNADYTVRNCIIYDGGRAGIRNNDATATGLVENCTIYGMIEGGTGAGLMRSSGTLTVTNTISMGNEVDFSGTITQSYNMSEDATANCGATCRPSENPNLQFVNITPGDEANWDFHLIDTTTADDVGTDLSAFFSNDIDLEQRPSGIEWDMGADERLTALSCPASKPSWFDNDWSYRKAIVVDSAKVTGAVTDFPVLVSLASDAELAADAQDDGDDIFFTASDGLTKLSHEIERFCGGIITAECPADTGELITWVKVPYVSSGANTAIYMYFGNGTVGSQEDAANAWDSNFQGVWHLNEDPADPAPEFLDSTSNPNDGTAVSLATANQVPGKIDGSIQFDDSNDRHVRVLDHASLDLPTDMTVSAWVKTSDTEADTEVIFAKWGPIGNRNYWLGKDNAATISFQVDDSSKVVTAPLALINVDGQWHHVVGVADATVTGEVRLYVDGSLVGGPAGGYAGSQTGTGELHIGKNPDAILFQEWSDGVDEVRVSGVARSADWILTEYNNQDDPASFYLLCSATTAVELTSFTAAGLDREVLLEWETGSELKNLGFHLYRSISEEGPYSRITASVIPGLGSSPQGATYRYRDSGLTNDVRYYYKLEDIETTGATELHGPVWATPTAEVEVEEDVATSGGEGGVEEDLGELSSRITYGEPSLNELKVRRRGKRWMELELITGGFHAVPQEDGSVLLEVPGFEDFGGPDLPDVPAYRTWQDVIAGRNVSLLSVNVDGVAEFASLRPSSSELIVVASGDGTVQTGRRRKKRRKPPHVYYPESWAQLMSVGFQGASKKALVEMAPFRWDATAEKLILAKRLLVRISFKGKDKAELKLGKSHNEVASHLNRSVLARLAVTEPGLYAVSFESVFGNRKKAIQTKNLRLSRQGEPVAFFVSPNPKKFKKKSKLYFLSDGADLNPYGLEAVYELESSQAGLKMESVDGSPVGTPTSFYWKTVQREENLLYQAAFENEESIWQWDWLFGPMTNSYPFEVTHLSSVAESSTLRVWLHGVSDFPEDPDHHVRLYINGILIDDTWWDGETPHLVEAELGPGLLQEGENALEIEEVGDTEAQYSMVMLDRFEVSYPAQLVDELNGRFTESGIATVPVAAGQIFDVTEPQPRRLSAVQALENGLSFGVESDHRYLLTQSVKTPEVRPARSAGLKKAWSRAEYLVIGPREFLSAAEPLLAHRRDEGLISGAIATEDIFDEFGYGEATPESIKEFLSYVYHHWSEPTLRYVVLLGDGTYDTKDYLATGVKNHVPVKIVETRYIWTASDPWYGAINGDDILPDVAVGRLPAASVEEVQSLVGKILAYESDEGDREAPIVLITDNPDVAGNFDANAEEIAATLLSEEGVEKVYLSQLGTAAAHGAILSAFDDGASIVSYLGHGAIHLWAQENLLDIWRVDSLAPQSQQPLLFTMNCLNGYFHFPYFNSLSEELLKAEGKGIIAAFSPTGLSLNSPAHRFHKALLQQVVHSGHERVGDAILAGQTAYAHTGAFPELLSIYHLLGDPALKLR